MSFAFLVEMVRQSARESVRKGEVTERSLARLSGMSQSHMHNVLKGIRSLKVEKADRLLSAMKLQLRDLIDELPSTVVAIESVPIMLDILGARTTEFHPHRVRGHVAVPAHIARAAGCPVAALIGEDFQLPLPFAPGDLVVIQQAKEFRSTIDPRAVYLVLTAFGPRLRYIRICGDRLFLPAEPYLRTPSAWESLSTSESTLRSSIYGRVSWVSRQLDAPRQPEFINAREPRRKPREFDELRSAS